MNGWDAHDGHERSECSVSSGTLRVCDTCRVVVDYTPEGYDQPFDYIPHGLKVYVPPITDRRHWS